MIVSRRAGSVEREQRLPIGPRQRPGPLSAATRVALTVLLPVLALATALLIGFLRPDDGRAFLAGLLFISFSSLFGLYYWTLPPGIREMAAVVHSGLASLFAYAFMRFFLVFPSPSPVERRLPWLKHVFLVPVVLLAALAVALNLLAGVSLEGAERIASLFRHPAVNVVYTIVFFGMLLLGLATGVWRAFAAPTADERRRMGIIIAGASAGLLPLIAMVVYVTVTGAATPAVWMTPIVVVTLPLFPLSFIYVVVRHRVLGVSLAIRRGLQYALMSRGVLVAEGLAVFLALYLGVGPLMARAFPEAGAGSIATTNVVAAAGAVLGLGLLRAGTTVVSRLRPTGMALGFDLAAAYGEGIETLAPGDTLLAFTDGLTEALNEAGEEFGDARAAGLLVGNRHLGASDLHRLVTAELAAFCGSAPQHDDVTIVVARVV